MTAEKFNFVMCIEILFNLPRFMYAKEEVKLKPLEQFISKNYWCDTQEF